MTDTPMTIAVYLRWSQCILIVFKIKYIKCRFLNLTLRVRTRSTIAYRTNRIQHSHAIKTSQTLRHMHDIPTKLRYRMLYERSCGTSQKLSTQKTRVSRTYIPAWYVGENKEVPDRNIGAYIYSTSSR
jgi:hypothetical protein